MFSKQQIEYMKKLGLRLDFDNPSEDDLFKVEEAVSERMQKVGFTDEYDATEDGKMCESILDRLA